MDEKRKLLGNCEKILKILDENSLEKWNFYLIFIFNFILNIIFENLLLKIESSKLTPFFFNNFFGFGGDFLPFPPPGYAHDGDYQLSYIFIQSGLANLICYNLTTLRYWQKFEQPDHHCWILPRLLDTIGYLTKLMHEVENGLKFGSTYST